MKNLLNCFFALFSFNKSFITSNLTVFKNFNILQIRLKKTNANLFNELILWCYNLKMTNYILDK